MAEPLTVRQVLAWADAHRERTGDLPTIYAGPIRDGAAGENSRRVDNALRYGLRGFPGGSSLAQLLAERRGYRNAMGLPPLTLDQVLGWADAHHATHGVWPRDDSGPVNGTAETWRTVDVALRHGIRGLPVQSSLARLLAAQGRAPNRLDVPRLRKHEIVAWARDHRRRTGKWPTRTSGSIVAAPGETWGKIDTALEKGGRGLPGGDSLAGLLARRVRAHNRTALPPLDLNTVLRWAQNHRRRTGRWPTASSGVVVGALEETWARIEGALRSGRRGLPGGSSLAKLLKPLKARAKA